MSSKKITIDEAAEEFSGLVVEYPTWVKTVERIKKVVKFNGLRKAPEPNCILISGPSGAGKTTLYEYLESQYVDEDIEDLSDRVVRKVHWFSASLPTTITPPRIALEILRSLGVETISEYGVEARLYNALKIAGTRGGMIDELHNLAGEDHSIGKVHAARGWIRDLVSKTKVMIIGFGTPDCHDIYLNEPQVRKRFPHVIQLESFQFPVNSNSEFMIVLAAFEKEIGSHGVLVANESRMNDDFIARFFAATGGSINAMKNIYETAYMNALFSDGRLDNDKFIMTCDELSISTSLTGSDNPFRLSPEACRNVIGSASKKTTLRGWEQ